MMLEKETFRLKDEVEEFAEMNRETAERLADKSPETQASAMLKQWSNEVDQAGNAVETLVDEFGGDATVTLRPLDAGLDALIEDKVQNKCEQLGTNAAPGFRRNAYSAAGLVDAPFFDPPTDPNDEPLDPDDHRLEYFERALDTVGSLPIGVVTWLEYRVDDISTLDQGNWTPLRELLKGNMEN